MPNLPSSAPSSRSKKRKLISNARKNSKTLKKMKTVHQKSPKKRDEPVRITRWTSQIYQVQGQVSRYILELICFFLSLSSFSTVSLILYHSCSIELFQENFSGQISF